MACHLHETLMPATSRPMLCPRALQHMPTALPLLEGPAAPAAWHPETPARAQPEWGALSLQALAWPPHIPGGASASGCRAAGQSPPAATANGHRGSPRLPRAHQQRFHSSRGGAAKKQSLPPWAGGRCPAF